MTGKNPKGRVGSRLDGVRGWRIAFLVLCTVGLCLAADLQRVHVKVHTDPDYRSYCAVSERVNCDTVALSKWAVVGGLPVASWGIFFYVALGALTVWGLRARLQTPSWPFGLLHAATLLSVVVSVGLYYVSHVLIESICPICVGSYAVNLALYGIALRELRRVGSGPWQALQSDIVSVATRRGPVLALGSAGAALILGALVAMPAYWTVDVAPSGPGGLRVGETTDGHPYIGAERPTVEIVEFSDYQCPHCFRGHTEMRRIVTDHPDQVRLVHRHYPLDHACNPTIGKPFHPLACEYSRLAYCAGEQRRFWEANDYLFEYGRRRQPVTTDELATALELDRSELTACVAGNASLEAVQHDLRSGIAIGVRGTPTFVFDGRNYPGGIPDDVIRQALQLGD